MARSIRLRKKKYTVYLDEVLEEVLVLSDPDDLSSRPVVKMKRSDPDDPDSELVPVLEPQLRAFEVTDDTPEGGTRFTLASMPLQKALNAGKLARKGEGAQAAYEALKAGLTGWTGLADEDGEDIPFNKNLIDMLGVDEAMPLAQFIMDKVAGTDGQSRKMVGNS
jgi:hypothetical protein